VDYWKHIEDKAGRFEQMWIELIRLNVRSKSERRETK